MPTKQKRRSREKTRRLLQECIHQTLARPEMLTVSQWAEKYRVLDESSSLPGKWSNTITPYLVKIMDCFNDPYIHEINIVKATQLGGTEAIINALGWIITKNPSPTMIVYPTDALAKEVSNDKLKPAFQKTPEVAERFFRTKSSEMNLRFKGMNVYLRSGSTPSKLASRAIKYLFFDEIDKMAGATKHEASPYNLAFERTKTFKHSRKIYTCSTPTYKENYIWKIHDRADEQLYYFVPCPNCGEMIQLLWGQIKFDENKNGELTTAERAATAMYYCQECGAEISDRDKPEMLRHGEWRDLKKTCKGKPTRVSFHINALYSFFVTWADAVKEFLDSKDDPETLQNFINSWLAEPWEDTRYTVSPDMVRKNSAPEAAGVVPEWAELLTAGVDVQQDCVYFDIVAWGAHLKNQSIMHGQVLSLSDIDIYMNAEYAKESGEKWIVSLCLVDSGDQTNMVYEYCMSRSWAYPAKGAHSMHNHYKVSTVDKPGKEYNGQQLILIDVSKYKDMIAAGLKDAEYGKCLVHRDCDEEYARQLASEHKVAEGKGVNRKLVWRKKTERTPNHFFDCRVYASAAADIRGVRAIGIENENNTDDVPETKNENKNSGWIKGY